MVREYDIVKGVSSRMIFERHHRDTARRGVGGGRVTEEEYKLRVEIERRHEIEDESGLPGKAGPGM